jgi:hypothetical protein
MWGRTHACEQPVATDARRLAADAVTLEKEEGLDDAI